jgi:hypothetical protein
MRLIINGYLRSSGFVKNTELTTPIFFSIKKLRIGMIMVRIKMGNMFPLFNSMVEYLGVIRKYETVPAKGKKIG